MRSQGPGNRDRRAKAGKLRELGKLAAARPFRPFVISLVDGQEWPVREAGALFVKPDQDVAFVFGADDWTMFWESSISAVSMAPSRRGHGG